MKKTGVVFPRNFILFKNKENLLGMEQVESGATDWVGANEKYLILNHLFMPLFWESIWTLYGALLGKNLF